MAHYQDAEEFHFNISSVSHFSEHSEENSHTFLIINIQVLPLKCLKFSEVSQICCHLVPSLGTVGSSVIISV